MHSSPLSASVCVGWVMFCFLPITTKMSMPFTVNKSFGAVTVVHLIEGTAFAFSCSQVQDTAPFSAIEGEALYILNRKLINALFSLTHATSVVLLSLPGPVSQYPLMTLRTSVLCELFSSWILSNSQWMFITVTCLSCSGKKSTRWTPLVVPFVIPSAVCEMTAFMGVMQTAWPRVWY